MGTTHRFLGVDDDADLLLNWFRNLPERPEETPTDSGSIVLYFRSVGPLVYTTSEPERGAIDEKRSPIVTLFLPRRKRGVLWTAGEVHFLPTPLRKVSPELDSISRRLGQWLAQFDRVFSLKPPVHEWDYFLEGGIPSRDQPVFALPNAMAALRAGTYFVEHDTTDSVLDKLCKALRLRGVACDGNADA